ncbi:Uncharacterized protein GBIM_12239, partial [Gryllus bimaculatus]
RAAWRRTRRPPASPPLPSLLGSSKRGGAPGAAGSPSLHSSNDSGFSNETPPQPEVDYSDDDSVRTNVFATVKLRKTATNDRSAPFIS